MDEKVNYEFMDHMRVDPRPQVADAGKPMSTQEISFHNVIGYAIGKQVSTRQGYVSLVAVNAIGDRLEITLFPDTRDQIIESRHLGIIEFCTQTHNAARNIHEEFVRQSRPCCKACGKEL